MSCTQKKGLFGFSFPPRGSRWTNGWGFSVFARRMIDGEREGDRPPSRLLIEDCSSVGGRRGGGGGGEGKEFGVFKNGEILEDAALERREKEALSRRVEELEKELYDYQYHMGLILVDKKMRCSEFEELRQKLAETKGALKQERAAFFNIMSDMKKQEQNALMALEIERQHVDNLQKTLWKMQDEHAAQHATLQTWEPTLQNHEKELQDNLNKTKLLNNSSKLRVVDICIKTQEVESPRKLNENERDLRASEGKNSENRSYRSKKQNGIGCREVQSVKRKPASISSIDRLEDLEEQCNRSLLALPDGVPLDQALLTRNECTKENGKVDDYKEQQGISAERISACKTETETSMAPKTRTSIMEDFLIDNQQLSKLVDPRERATKRQTDCQHERTELDDGARDFETTGSFENAEKSPDILMVNEQSESKLPDDRVEGNAEKKEVFFNASGKVLSEMDLEDNVAECGPSKRQRTSGPGISSPGEKRYNFRASTILKVTRSQLQKSEHEVEEGVSDGGDIDYEPTGSD